LAELIKEEIGMEVHLEVGERGELSVYWQQEKLSDKEDPIQEIIAKLRLKKQELSL